MRIIISLGLAILLSSCAATSTNYYTKTVQSWQGGDTNTLVKRWGTPDGRLAGDNGKIAYIYKYERNNSNGARYSPSIGVNFTPGGKPVLTSTPETNRSLNNNMSLNCITVFVANKNGKIIDTLAEGNGCYGGQ